MSSEHSPDAKVYTAQSGRSFSMKDLLALFHERGQMRVTDLHLKIGCPPVYRVDGRLERMAGPELSVEAVEALALSLLPDEEVQALRRDRSVDGSYALGQSMFRINCFYDNEGLAMALRALDSEPPGVEKIGFPNGVWQDVIQQQYGLVLVTGITGAGKSTTIAAMIRKIAHSRHCRIITLEDPIEYRLTSDRAIVSQREVGRDVANFERGLRDCLREDPDVIFVGEMRDRESAQWTLTAAETGHLVFSTLHTRDARGTITRILDMFRPGQQHEVASQLSLGLSHVICQKLVPRCDGGGRAVAMEILNNNYAVAHLIRTQKLEQLYSQMQTKTRDVPEERMVTLERSLALLVARGVVAPQEAEKWANDHVAYLDEVKRAMHGD
jgi:twitching motility protein PilT